MSRKNRRHSKHKDHADATWHGPERGCPSRSSFSSSTRPGSPYGLLPVRDVLRLGQPRSDLAVILSSFVIRDSDFYSILLSRIAIYGFPGSVIFLPSLSA